MADDISSSGVRTGVSVWLEGFDRALLRSGSLARLVAQSAVVGMVADATTLADAVQESDDYTAQITELGARGAGVDEAVEAVVAADAREACDLLAEVFERTGGQDGVVSVGLDPRLARNTSATIEAARRLWEAVARPNLLVQLPATLEALPVIITATAEGVGLDVTSICSLDRYRGVVNDFFTGLEQARQHGRDLSAIHSVASIVLAPVDAEVDRLLDAVRQDGDAEAQALRGRAAVANAVLACQVHEEVYATPRWANLADDGAHRQRLRWAGTTVTSSDRAGTGYVTELATPGVVLTVRAGTLDAIAADRGVADGAADGGVADGADDSGVAVGAVPSAYEAAADVLDGLARLGVAYPEVMDHVEDEGVSALQASWAALRMSVSRRLDEGGLR